MDETNLPVTNPEELSEGGNADVSSADLQTEEALTLTELNALTNRTFGSKTDALKHIEGLNKLVGDQKIAETRKKADNYDALNRKYNALVGAYATENSMTVEEATQEIGKFTSSVKETETDASSRIDKELSSLKKEMALDKFLSKHPETKEYIDVIEAVADRKGISFEEALLDSSLAKMVPKPSGVSTTEPNKRVQVQSQELKQIQDKVASGRGTFDDKQNLVRGLGLAK